ncbi:MAG: protein kinase [Pontiellaceae bacterium]|nr:protein kinase [Pontiellaceae bacterium]
MNCPNCNIELPEGAKFCLECGSNISAISKASSMEQPDLQNSAPTAGPSSVEPFSLGDMPTMPNVKGAKSEYSAFSDGKLLAQRYEFIEELGRGGFAVVWKALDRKLGRTVAIKKLHAEQDDVVIERFKREAQVIAQLNHRNVVGVYDVAEDVADGKNEVWLVMEYIDGGSLRDYLRQKGKLEIPEAVRLFKGIAQGLAYAHRKNLVHRDIKPTNILLQNDGGELIPKIVDFGLAQAGRNSELSISGYGLGTPYYMPPEQQRDAKSVNHTADIYALGKVLYEMISGQLPDTLDPDGISNPKLSKIIFKCTKSKPEERFFSVDELCRAVEELEVKKQKPVRKPESTSSILCPSCGLENSSDVSFCSGCGAGLYHTCPECSQKEFVDSRFCSSCGTDIDGFLNSQEVLSRMQKYVRSKKWSRVLKEFDEWDDSVRLDGHKGVSLIREIKKVEEQARQSIEEAEKLNNVLRSLEQSIVSKETDGKSDIVVLVQELRKLMATLSRLAVLEVPSDEHLRIKKEAQERIDRIVEEEELRASKVKSRKRWLISLGVAGVAVSIIAGGLVSRFRTKMEWEQAKMLQQDVLSNMGKKVLTTDSGFKMEFLPIPEGEFLMGENTEYEHLAVVDKPFWMAKTEVSKRQWKQIMGNGKYGSSGGDDLPVENVTWLEAIEFCNRLTKIDRKAGNLNEGYVYTLPTEVQWEYACKAKVSGDYCFGSAVWKLNNYAWWSGNAGSETHPVGSSIPNAWGLHNMHGNAWEWCIAEGRKITDEPAAEYMGHVCRGGAWSSEWWNCRADSYKEFTDERSYSVGFRVAIVPLDEDS